MPEFDPSKGPQFTNVKQPERGSTVTPDEAVGLGFAAGFLGGGITQAAELSYALDYARSPKPSRLRRLFRRS